MKESLESARNIHQILIVLLSVIGIFAISVIFETNPFDAGLKMIADSEDKAFDAIMKNKVRVKYEKPALKIYRKAEIDSSNKNIADTMNIAKLRSEMNSWEAERRVIRKKRNNLISQIRSEIDSAEAKLDISWLRTANTELTNTLIDRALTEISYEQLFASNKRMIKYENLSTNLIPMSDMYQDSLVSLSQLNEIVYPGDTPKIFTDVNGQNNGNLDYFYSINKDKSVKECKALLNKESANFKNNPHDDVDLSGIRVASKHMYIVAPFVIFCLIIYLYSLVSHLNSTINVTVDAEGAQEFPWLALFPGVGSKILLFISIVLFPTVITWATALSSELPPSEKGWWTWCYLIFFSVLGLELFLKIDKLNIRIHKRPFV